MAPLTQSGESTHPGPATGITYHCGTGYSMAFTQGSSTASNNTGTTKKRLNTLSAGNSGNTVANYRKTGPKHLVGAGNNEFFANESLVSRSFFWRTGQILSKETDFPHLLCLADSGRDTGLAQNKALALNDVEKIILKVALYFLTIVFQYKFTF